MEDTYLGFIFPLQHHKQLSFSSLFFYTLHYKGQSPGKQKERNLTHIALVSSLSIILFHKFQPWISDYVYSYQQQSNQTKLLYNSFYAGTGFSNVCPFLFFFFSLIVPNVFFFTIFISIVFTSGSKGITVFHRWHHLVPFVVWINLCLFLCDCLITAYVLIWLFFSKRERSQEKYNGR